MSEIASIIWPRQLPKTWNATLRTVISKVRQTLESAGVPGDSLRSRRGYVRFAPPDSVLVDLETVRAHCLSADEPPSIRADRAQVVHRLLAIPPLRGIAGDWADDVRAECETLRAHALDIDATASSRTGSFERSISCAEALIDLDPLRERAYRVSMRAHMELGDIAQALDVAARCRRALSEQLGVDPSPETQQVFLEALARVPVAADATPESVPSIQVLPANGSAPIGRLRELDTIARAFEEAKAGVGQCVVVTGDAGTGKTTVVLEAMARARAQHADVLFGRCSEDAIIAFEPFVEAVCRELDGMGVAGARAWLTENGCDILRLIPHAANRFGDLAPDASVDVDRAAIVTAVHRWLTSAERSVPTVLVVDDLQWASGATHSLLRYLFQAASVSSVCFVVTARTQSLDDSELNKTLNIATRLGHVHRASLSEFTVDEVAELVEARSSPMDPVALHVSTRGHPLFVTSLLAEWPNDIGGAVPESILEFVRRVEDGLSDAARTLLRVCAVIGTSISRQVLRAAAGDIDDTEFSDALDELFLFRMIDLAAASDQLPTFGGRTAYLSAVVVDDIELRHPLVQEVVYSGIAPGRRSILHSRVGNALVQRSTSPAGDESARIAYHFNRGLPSDNSSSRDFGQRAADHAYALGAYEDAVALYMSAIGRTPPQEDSPQHCALLIGLGRALRGARDADARTPALAALAMARRLGDRSLELDAALGSERRGMMFVQQYSVDVERVDLIESILGDMVQAEECDTSAYAILLSQSVIERAWDSDHLERAELVSRAIDTARRLGDGPLLARVSVAALMGLRVPHSSAVTDAALSDLNDSIDARPELIRDASVAVWLARARLGAGDLVGARAALDAITEAHINGDPELEWLVNYGSLGIELASGRLVDCEARLERIRAIPPSPTDVGYYGRLLPVLTALGTLRGDLREVVGQAALMRARFDGNPTLRPALAVAMLDVDDRRAASELMLWYNEERIAAIAVDPMWLSTLVLIGRAAAELSMGPLCERIYRLLDSHAECTVLTWATVYGVVHHHLAHLALGFGDFTRASYHIADAQNAHAERGFAAWEVESDYLALRIAAARTGSVETSSVRAVCDRADVLGATAVRRRADALAASISTVA